MEEDCEEDCEEGWEGNVKGRSFVLMYSRYLVDVMRGV